MRILAWYSLVLIILRIIGRIIADEKPVYRVIGAVLLVPVLVFIANYLF